MQTIALVDYGMGNLHSAAKAVEKVAPDVRVLISQKPEEILAADRVIFPGVGAMRDCMHEIHAMGLDEVVREAARSRPLLGICVGMQAMLQHSDENNGVDCLGLFAGNVEHFASNMTDAAGKLKIPHMGWNQVHQRNNHPLWANIEQDERFYFVHSYFVKPQDEAIVAADCEYGVKFCAALTRDNVFAVQFHPEKSHKAGLQLLANFANWKV